MYKRLMIVCILCIMLTACDSKDNAKNDNENISKSISEKESESSINGDENLTSNIENSESNIGNKAGQEKVIDILNKVQQDGQLAAFNFYENNMYILTKAEGGIVLRKYNMDTWEEISVATGIDDGDSFALVPNSTGIVVKRNYFSENCNNYFFDEKLNKVAECQGLLADYSAKGDILYYYDKGERKIYGKEIEGGKINIIREFVDGESDEAKLDDIRVIEELAVSSDGNYIFYVGMCQGKDSWDNVWGYFDIENIENDTMYKENKTIQASERGIIVTDSKSGSYMIGQEPVLSKEYFYFGNGKERESRQFKNAKESDSGVYSCEGNILLTLCYDGISAYDGIVYDVIDNKEVADYKDDIGWTGSGIICEKFKVIFGMYPIHESPDVFSPTGKHEIWSITY